GRPLRHPGAAPLRAIAARPDQRRLLRHAVARAGGDLRPAQHRQHGPRRAVHDGRLRGLAAAGQARPRLLVGAAAVALHRGRVRRRAGEAVHQPALQARPPLWAAAHLRPGAGDRGGVPQRVRLLRPALPHPPRAGGVVGPRLHVPAHLPRLGGGVRARGLPRHLAGHREDAARRLSAGGDGERAAGAGLRRQRAAHGHADLRGRGGVGRARRRAGGADLLREPADGVEPHHRGLRGGGDRGHGLHPRRGADRLRPRHRRGDDQGLLPRGLRHRDLRHHGHRPAGTASGPVREGL
ncbi:MAG: High-affinity branched-chain amino acid transport system permease protein LivH, partial [uncultured Acetobacteraceae bacterium]